MYGRLVKIKNKGREFVYLRLLEKIKENGRWKERVVANLGRQDIKGRETLGELLKSLRRFTDEVLVSPEEIESRRAKDYGAVLVGQKLWQEIGLDRRIREICGEPKGISLGEPGVLAMVLNRLTSPKSKLAFYDWMPTVYLPDWQTKKFDLPDEPDVFADRFYQTMDWLIAGKNKEKIEEHVGSWAQTLFPVEVVFYDISNIQFEGWQELKQARHGYIRLGRKNHKQILLGLIMVEGLPVASHIFRGNRAEKTTLLWVKDKIKKQFNVGRIVFVCDRGMISEANLKEIESQQDGYIVAIKRRRCEEGDPLLEKSLDSFTPIRVPEDGEPDLLAWEAPLYEGKRRIVVYNPIKAEEEKNKRQEIIRKLEIDLEDLKAKVQAGKPKKVQAITTAAERILSRWHAKRYFRYTSNAEGHFEFTPNEESRALEEKLGGKFIVKTTETNLSTKEAVFKYKDLMEIEHGFRDLKDFIRVAPVFHRRYRRVKAHVFICVLALLLERYLEEKLKKAGLELSAKKAIEKLKTIKVVENRVGNLDLKYVTPPNIELAKILAACDIFKLPKILSDSRLSQKRNGGSKPAK
ncbi:MAG: IS1634 family transposase [Candidatus Omnitrophica bacterium]|nr:IS1634 family transposase [Candidatus Omnitrophota bacterium]